MSRLVVALVAALLAVGHAAGLAVGPLATRPALAQTQPPLDVPAAEECEGPAQRSVAPLFASPAADPVAATPGPFVPPVGETADEAQVAAMTGAIRAVVACINTGQYFPVLTLVSDDYLRERFLPGAPDDPLSEELRPFVDALRGCQSCQVEPLSEAERFGLVSVEQPQRLADGRLSAVFRLSTPEAAATGVVLVAFVAFVPSGDRLLVDEIVEIEMP